MLARCSFAFAIALATVFAGCGGKEEVKKNEGKLVNTPPTSVSAPSGGTTASGEPAANKAVAPPPIPKINE